LKGKASRRYRPDLRKTERAVTPPFLFWARGSPGLPAVATWSRWCPCAPNQQIPLMGGVCQPLQDPTAADVERIGRQYQTPLSLSATSALEEI
jgi:hypothetical protein